MLSGAALHRAVSADAEGITSERLVVAGLLYRYGPTLAQQLNVQLAAQQCGPRRTVPDVIMKVQDPDTSVGHRVRLLAALEATFRPYMAPGASLETLMAEWMYSIVWMDICLACAHPRAPQLQGGGGMAELWRAACEDAGYAPVRSLVAALTSREGM